MIFDINMFGPLMIHLIFSQMYCALAITKYFSHVLLQPKSLTKPLDQIASFTASVTAIYSAFVLDKATVGRKL
jgi:hypothetical protein